MRFLFISTVFLVSCKTAPVPDAVTPNPNLIISTSPDLNSSRSNQIKISLDELKKHIDVENFEVKSHPVHNGKTVIYRGFSFDQIISYIT